MPRGREGNRRSGVALAMRHADSVVYPLRAQRPRRGRWASRLSPRGARHALPTGWAKKMAQFFVYLITSPNINRFSKFFHCQNQETICNKTDPTTRQMCRYTTSWNIRWRTQACNATDRLRDQRWSSLACGPPNNPDSQLAKKTIVAEWGKVPQRLVDRAIGQWRRRFRCVVQQQGGNIENLMWKL